jgi:hypothetical protein
VPYFPTRKLTILALDPSVRIDGKLFRTQIEIPNEVLDRGPRGYRVHVIDYDSTRDALYPSGRLRVSMNCDDRMPEDPWENTSDADLLKSLDFHAWMTYAVIMKTLARFEFALGRRASWSFGGHQILVSPHAFSDANAFYSDQAQGLFFGYFPSFDGRRTVFTCLSHEIIAHETTHALLDGLRERYMDPSSPQQAGFHEAFADIVALLSVFSAQSVVARLVDAGMPDIDSMSISRMNLTPATLRASALFGLAPEMGSELSGIHGQALRRSIALPPNPNYLASPLYQEAHMCGEVLVAAVLNAFLDVWIQRLVAVGSESSVNRARASEEGAELADHMLTIFIRAIDYCPPTDLQFCDFASGVITADWELNPKDDKYHIRVALRKWFAEFGIKPSSRGAHGREPGSWEPPPAKIPFKYDRTHFESMKSDPDEVFRFLWVNRKPFQLNDQALTRVLSVRPCVSTGRDGFTLRETVVEFHQQLKVFARELAALNIRKPQDMPDATEVTLYGGNAVVFDEYGHVKYNIGNSVLSSSDKHQSRQSARLQYLWDHGDFSPGASKLRAFATMHRLRSTSWYRSANVAREEEV